MSQQHPPRGEGGEQPGVKITPKRTPLPGEGAAVTPEGPCGAGRGVGLLGGLRTHSPFFSAEEWVVHPAATGGGESRAAVKTSPLSLGPFSFQFNDQTNACLPVWKKGGRAAE